MITVERRFVSSFAGAMASRVHPEPNKEESSPLPLKPCKFWFLDADYVREYEQGKNLPVFQELQKLPPERKPLCEVEFTWSDVVLGKHAVDKLTVSHRWMEHAEKDPNPDPRGDQLAALKERLTDVTRWPECKNIKKVWIDYQCMPQDCRIEAEKKISRKNETTKQDDTRNEKEKADFDRMLKNVNMLYLGTQVLILLDPSYISRFWVRRGARS